MYVREPDRPLGDLALGYQLQLCKSLEVEVRKYLGDALSLCRRYKVAFTCIGMTHADTMAGDSK